MSTDTLKAVLFDLDGTLLYTLPDIAGALNRALAAEGLPEHPLEDYTHIVGGGIRTAIRRAAPAGTDPAVLEAIHTHYQGDYPLHCADQTRRYPGVDTLLTALRDAGVALGIISNKTETTSQRIAAHFFPDIPFRMVWGNNGERPLKPAADAGQLACAQLGLPAGAVAYVGDSDVDMRFAQQSGFLAVGAAWGYRGAEELTAAGADWLCADAGALLARLRDALPALR